MKAHILPRSNKMPENVFVVKALQKNKLKKAWVMDINNGLKTSVIPVFICAEQAKMHITSNIDVCFNTKLDKLIYDDIFIIRSIFCDSVESELVYIGEFYKKIELKD